MECGALRFISSIFRTWFVRALKSSENEILVVTALYSMLFVFQVIQLKLKILFKPNTNTVRVIGCFEIRFNILLVELCKTLGVQTNKNAHKKLTRFPHSCLVTCFERLLQETKKEREGRNLLEKTNLLEAAEQEHQVSLSLSYSFFIFRLWNKCMIFSVWIVSGFYLG